MLELRYGSDTSRNNSSGVNRRTFLQVGSLALGGLSLRELLAAESTSGRSNPHKAVIMIYLVGGPPHQDLWDLKPDAPSEVAGPMRPIATNVPGIEICELLPQLARRTDRLSIIRSIADSQADHDAYQCFTGRKPGPNVPAGGWPQFGSVVSRVLGPTTPSVPGFASLCYTCTHGPYNEPGPGFLGVGQTPLQSRGKARENMVLQGITAERMSDRKSLLAGVDRLRRDIDQSRKLTGMDEIDRKSTRLNSSHVALSRMPSSA